MKQAIIKAKSLFQKYGFANGRKHKKTLILLFICLILGMIFGAISVSYFNLESIYKLDFLFLNDFKGRINQSNLEIFISSFSILSLFALFTELNALSCWGAFFIPFIVAFKGIGLGISAGYLYLIYGLKGIAFYLLILLPGIFISSVGITLLAGGCMKFSFKLLKSTISKDKKENLRSILKQHLKKSAYCLIILAISSAIDVCFMIMFSRFFNFS